MAVRLKFKSSLNNTSPCIKPFYVGASQTLYAGDVLALSSNLAVAAADAPNTRTIIGVATSDATTTSTVTTADVIYADVNPASIYEIVHSGSATPAIGACYDFATAPYTMDSDDTTGGFLQVVGNVATNTADIILNKRVFGML